MKDMEKRGYFLAKGAVWYLVKLWLIGLVLSGIVMFLRLGFGIGVDATGHDVWNRSGLTIRTDAETGLQYLSTPSGGLTPRLGSDGLPMVSIQ